MGDLSKTYYQIEQFLSDLESKGIRVQSMERRTLLAYAEDKEMVALLRQWAAIDVPQFFHFVSLRYSKSRLNDELDLFNTASDIRDRDSGIAHSSFLDTQMVSAAEFKNALEDTLISWTILETVFGNLLLVESDYGICKMSFIDEDGFNTEELALEFPFSRLINQQGPNAALVKSYLSDWEIPDQKISLFISGTPFQQQVWKALLTIPFGSLRTYDFISKNIANPKAIRAVGTAIGKNPITYLIPCHRVVRTDGYMGQFRWKAERKKLLNVYEAAQKPRMAF